MSLSLYADNCMDPGWLISHQYTPSGPDDLQVAIETRIDKTGKLQPVLQANWTLKDDGESVLVLQH